MKRFLLTVTVMAAIASTCLALDKLSDGRAVLYAYAENSVFTTEPPIKTFYSEEHTPYMMYETEPGSNLFILTHLAPMGNPEEGYNYSFGEAQKLYLFTELFDDIDSFDKTKNLLGTTAGTIFDYELPYVATGKIVDSSKGEASGPFAISELDGNFSSFMLILDLNKGTYAFDYAHIPFVIEKGKELTYDSPKEELTAARSYGIAVDTFAENHPFEAPKGEKKFRLAYNLSPDPHYLEITAPSKDLLIDFAEDGIAVDKETVCHRFYSIYEGSGDYPGNKDLYDSCGWFILPDREGHWLNIQFYCEDADNWYSGDMHMKAFDYNEMKQLYFDDSEAVFDWEGYMTPTIDKKNGWTNILEPVEGKIGVFHGKVAIPYKPEWNYRGFKVFDRFADSESDKDQRACSTLVPGQYEMDFETGYTESNTFRWSERRDDRVGILWYSSVEPEVFDVEFDLINNTSYVYTDPEIFPYKPEYSKSPTLYLIGNCEGWDIRDCSEEWQLGLGNDGAYVRTLDIPAEAQFRFYTQLGQWDSEHSIGADWYDFSQDEIVIGDGYHGTVCVGGMGNWVLSDWEGGYLTIRVDTNLQEISMVPADSIPDDEPVPSSSEAQPVEEQWETLYVEGSMGKTKLDKVDDYKFKGTFGIPAGEQTFRFVTGDNVENKYIGANIPDRLVLTEEATGQWIYSRRRAIPGKDNYWKTSASHPGAEVKVIVDKLNHSIVLNADTSKDEVEVITIDQNQPQVIYNLQGIPVKGDNLPAGIYIINGKKQLVR